jgi:S-formylglutathione hydrolase FrmB
MKTFKRIRLFQLSGVCIVLSAIVLLSSCSTKYAFATSSVVPAAEGTVKVKKDKNNNYNIELKVERLADPKRLSPAREVYVVWMETDQNERKNIGQLKTSSGLFSGALKSSLKTVSPFKPLTFFITAEESADIQYPMGQEVLRTNSF